MVHCHCSMCRRHHGAMFATFLTGGSDSFRWLAGQDRIVTYRSSAKGLRPFCGTCGSVVPTTLPQIGVAFVAAGNLEGDPGLRPERHMFASSGAAWFPITDALARDDAFPPGFEDSEPVEAAPLPPARTGIVRGHCLCGDVAFEIAGEPELLQNCHCSRCRRARSAAHATNAFYRRDQLTWVRGEDRVERYSLAGAQRFGQDFCRRCGSPVARVVASTGYVVVPCGSLDDAPGVEPRGHIFVGSKAPWHEITDDLPQWEALPA
ncbi:MAG TPA: GFA family protein [Steroidobacteraceae bacterium]|nr:GFA family protein [Steroidobacteraceae bacterium]